MYKKRIYNSDEKSSSMMQHEMIASLMNIQEKLNNPVFNGGFETLLLKVDGIEKTQKQTLDEVAELNKTIFDPDEGLYSRIKNVNNDVDELTDWKRQVEEKSKENDEAVKTVKSLSEWKSKLDEKIKTYDQNTTDVTQLKDWKNGFHKLLWWLLPAIGTLLLKTCFDFIVQHVVIK